MGLKISFFRGDYFEYNFRIIDDDCSNIQLGESDNIIFSAKTRCGASDYVLQKQLNEGIKWDEEKRCYTIQFNHLDTKSLRAQTYAFDIVVIYEGVMPETHTGELILLPDVTRNEVSE